MRKEEEGVKAVLGVANCVGRLSTAWEGGWGPCHNFLLVAGSGGRVLGRACDTQ